MSVGKRVREKDTFWYSPAKRLIQLGTLTYTQKCVFVVSHRHEYI